MCLSVCHFVLVLFSPFSIAITSLGDERANLSAFRTFVRFVLVWILAAVCDCGTPWTFLLTFFYIIVLLSRNPTQFIKAYHFTNLNNLCILRTKLF